MKGALVTKYITTRELNVWRRVALGQMNKEIASLLNISIKTVEKHRLTLGRKLRLHCAADITRRAIECGVINVKITPLRLEKTGKLEKWMLP